MGSGLREPNGLVMGPDGELFATDNDGEWVPSNKLVHIRKDGFYGMCVGTSWDANLVISRPAVWFPQLLRSPGQPVLPHSGIYRDQMVVGDYALLTLSRIFLEKVGGNYQGALFPFSGGLISGALRLAVDDKESLYMGEIEIESTEGWFYKGDPKYRPNHVGFGLQKIIHSSDSAFEMLAIRATEKGFAVEFTLPVGEMAGDPTNYRIQQWRYEPTFNYGGPMLDLETLPVTTTIVSKSDKVVVLEIPGLKTDRVVHIQLHKDFRSATGKKPWVYEAWYTLNAIPNPGNGIHPVSAPEVQHAFTIMHEGCGRISIRVQLKSRYSLRVANLRGEHIFSAQGSGPAIFPLDPGLHQGVYSISLNDEHQCIRSLIQAF